MTNEELRATAQNVLNIGRQVTELIRHRDDLLKANNDKLEALRSLRDRPRRIMEWATSVFGGVASNKTERALRVVEEALEVAQAVGVGREAVALISERVYSRPVGEVEKEIGALLLTTEALSAVLGICPQEAISAEWVRVLEMDVERLRERHAAKVSAGTAL